MQQDRSGEGKGMRGTGGSKWEEELEVASMVVEGIGVVLVEVGVDSRVMGRVGARVEHPVMVEIWGQGQGEVVDKREVATGARVGLEVGVALMLRLGWSGRQSFSETQGSHGILGYKSSLHTTSDVAFHICNPPHTMKQVH